MRAAGILMPISSLPGKYGIGTMGEKAKEFVDFLVQAGQTYWQILPLNPTGFGNSPYQSFSTFAGNPYLIDIDDLLERELLLPEEVETVEEERVDFGYLYSTRFALLRKAFTRFVPGEEYFHYCEENAAWLPDYALFMALKQEFGNLPWLFWPKEIRLREESAMALYTEKCQEEIAFWYFLQFTFATQWQTLRQYAGEKGIRIIGDVPIYVSLDSADLWGNPELFLLDENREPTLVAGCPPDFFSEKGQLWGNPLYDWEKMEEDGFKWWCARLAAAGKLYDTVRLDHFRGFESFWAVPADAENAIHGKWMKGPGLAFVHAVQLRVPQVSFIAEDLGFLTEEAHALRRASGWPGMKVLQFAFDDEDNDYLPHHYTKNCVCYLGTHDNAPACAYLEEIPEETRKRVTEYLALTKQEGYVWGLLRGAMASVADTFIAQMQDYLGLGAESRINTPGLVCDKNWTWRAPDGAFTSALAEKIRTLTKRYGR